VADGAPAACGFGLVLVAAACFFAAVVFDFVFFVLFAAALAM
jgi:hypothetical protein